MSDQSDIARRHVPGELFSMEAADNAEVVPPVPPPRGPDSMWSTSAPQHGSTQPGPTSPNPTPQESRWDGSGAPNAATAAEDDPWQEMGSSTPPPGVGAPFAPRSGANGSAHAAGARHSTHDAPGDPWRTLPRDQPPPGVVGVFSDWPASVSYYASCMNLK